MENYCRKMAWLLYNRGLVDKENVEDLRFLLELILTQVITIISVYIIGLLFMDALSILIICACFVAGRKYLDGYHADTFRNCYLLTMLNFIFCIFMSRIVAYVEIFYFIGIGISLYLLFKYRYKKIIIFNLFYILIIVLFNTGIVYQINMVNYFVRVLMRVIRGEELK